MYTKEEEIIHFVFLAFKGMKRKKEDIDLAFHSIMVANMLKDCNCNKEIVFIGYLHDIIEDTKFTFEDIKDKYGANIANGVLELTEDKTINNWKKRKEKFIEKMYKINNDILLIELADKLQNLISDYHLFLEKGRSCLNTECDNYEEAKWYYTKLQELFNKRINNNILLDRYNKIMKIYFE